MHILSWLPSRPSRRRKRLAGPDRSATQRAGKRLRFEQLEGRALLSTWSNVASVAELIADINAANALGGDNTITLAPGKTFTLTAVDNNAGGWGPTGLPAIAANNRLTIQGNGDTILRSVKAPAFRLFEVDAGASLTLENLTLKGGRANGRGGAIANQGDLTLSGVTVTGNTAVGTMYLSDDLGGTGYIYGESGQGGGIWSCHTLTLQRGTVITNNSAVGYNNGSGVGGGVCAVAGLSDSLGSATLTDVTISSNTAQGGGSGKGGKGAGSGCGGGLFLAGFGTGTGITPTTLTNVTLSSNIAMGGKGQTGGGEALGGGLYVEYATVTLSSVTLSSNAALGGYGQSQGGGAWGGGLYLDYGNFVSLTGCTLSSNRAVGGNAAPSGTAGGAFGGALFVRTWHSDTLTLRNNAVTGNSAQGGTAGSKIGTAQGGGIYIFHYDGGAGIGVTGTVYLDAFTVTHTTGNKPDEIDDYNGSYILIP